MSHLQSDFGRVQWEGDKVSYAGSRAGSEELDCGRGHHVCGFHADHFSSWLNSDWKNLLLMLFALDLSIYLYTAAEEAQQMSLIRTKRISKHVCSSLVCFYFKRAFTLQ